MQSDTYTYIGEYRIKPDAESAFREHYGPEGDWVRLFRKAPGYVSTQLYQDREHPHRYLTVDRWESEQTFRDFRRRFAAAFEELDKLCEGFTRSETPLGSFADIGRWNDTPEGSAATFPRTRGIGNKAGNL